MSGREEFYVGYRERAPEGLARFLRRVVLVLAIGGAGLAAALVTLQDRFDPGAFEFGVVREYEGVIEEAPVPLLRVETPVEVGGAAVSRFLLVGFGKHGAARQVEGLDGRTVRLSGSLIHREGEAMLELVDGSVRPLPLGAEKASEIVAADLGRRTLRGEIVDSKCFLGVMKPGRGKPHRACAARCISGGIPPVLRVETPEGDFRHFLLTDEAGGPVNDRVLGFVAEPIEITGEVRRRGDLLILAADPAGYERL